MLQTPTDDDDDRRQHAKQYWPIRRACNKQHTGYMYQHIFLFSSVHCFCLFAFDCILYTRYRHSRTVNVRIFKKNQTCKCQRVVLSLESRVHATPRTRHETAHTPFASIPRDKVAWGRIRQYILKGKGFLCSLPNVGSGADPGVLYMQSVSPQMTISPAVACRYFPPGLRLPSQPHGITDPCP